MSQCTHNYQGIDGCPFCHQIESKAQKQAREARQATKMTVLGKPTQLDRIEDKLDRLLRVMQPL